MDRHLIVGYCWGAAGSRWLARFMNAHPDVWFTHGYPGDRDKGRCLDYFRWMSMVASHPYFGAIHHISAKWHKDITRINILMKAFVLVRHPILRIRSIMALNNSNPIRATFPGYKRRVRNARAMLEKAGAPPVESGSFLSSCLLQSNSHRLDFGYQLPVFKIEDLNTVEGVTALLDCCWDLRLWPGQKSLLGKRVGVHAGGDPTPEGVWSSWPGEWRQAYRVLMSKEAREALREHYEWVP